MSKPKYVVMMKKEFSNPDVGPTGDVAGVPCTAWDTLEEARKDIGVQVNPKWYYIEEYDDEIHGPYFEADPSEF